MKHAETIVETAWFQGVQLYYDQPLLNFAYNVNLRRYTMACALLALNFPECTKLLGPIVPGVTVRCGAHVIGRGLHSTTAQLNLSQFWSLKP